LIGKHKAIELILTGEIINAQEAFRIGLVNRTIADRDLMPVVTDMAHKMASKSPIASRYAKEAIHEGLDLTLAQGLRLEADLYFLLHTTRDRAEGISAFQETRKARFEGK
jgi:enoyl-CoA hydratase/carnithine racemase